jgi:hypothetical protein
VVNKTNAAQIEDLIATGLTRRQALAAIRKMQRDIGDVVVKGPDGKTGPGPGSPSIFDV